jgi:hypothetical protein
MRVKFCVLNPRVDDSWLDLLFYHRDLKRLIAVELKIGKFLPQHEGQMRFYLKWLDRYERRQDENEPIGLISNDPPLDPPSYFPVCFEPSALRRAGRAAAAGHLSFGLWVACAARI